MTLTRRLIFFWSPTCLAMGLNLASAQAFVPAHPMLAVSSTAASVLPVEWLSQGSVILWQGQGRIVQGRGQGGVVQLTLRFDGRRVWTVPGQGPPLNQPTTTLNGVTLRDGIRVWTFRSCGEGLCVSVSQRSPHQVVHYVLYRQ